MSGLIKKGIAFVLIIAIAGAGFLLWSNYKKGTHVSVAVLNSKNISLSEYLLYFRVLQGQFEDAGGKDIWDTNFDGESAFTVAKQNALDSIVYAKTIADIAQTQGIMLSAEELKLAEERAELYFSNLNKEEKEAITYESVLEAIKDSMLYDKLYTQTIEDCVISEGDFQVYFREYLLELEAGGATLMPNELAEAEKNAREIYAESVQDQFFADKYADITGSAKAEKNTEAWNAIQLLKEVSTISWSVFY